MNRRSKTLRGRRRLRAALACSVLALGLPAAALADSGLSAARAQADISWLQRYGPDIERYAETHRLQAQQLQRQSQRQTRVSDAQRRALDEAAQRLLQ